MGAMMTDDDILRLVAEKLGNPLLFEDLKEDFTVHTEAEDWIKFARALLSASKPAAPQPAAVYPQGVMGIPPYSPPGSGSMTVEPGISWNATAAAPAQSHLTSNTAESNDRQIDAPAQSGEPITKEWCMKMAVLEPDDGDISAGVPNAKTGWKLVPMEPTDTMTYVGQQHRYEAAWSIGAIYREMLLAAPQPSQPAEGGEACVKCGYSGPPSQANIKSGWNQCGGCGRLQSAVVLDDERVTGIDIALDALSEYQRDWDTGLPAEYAQTERIAMECAVEAVREVLNEARAASPQPATLKPMLDKAERDISASQVAAQPVAPTERALTDVQVIAYLEPLCDKSKTDKADVLRVGRALLTAAQPASGSKP
jgi:hypothetical protein